MVYKKKDIVYVGVVGQIACGKGRLVEYLVKKYGFIAFSLSTIVHEELKKRGFSSYSRKNLQDIGDELRKKYGRDFLSKRAIKFLESTKTNLSYKDQKQKIVIEGIRNPAEVEYLKTLPNFVLIGIKAKRKLRFQRLLKRKKPWDPKTWQEFLMVDRRDLGIGQQSAGQQVGKCFPYCDYVLTNNKDIRDFQRKAEELIKRIFKLNETS